MRYSIKQLWNSYNPEEDIDVDFNWVCASLLEHIEDLNKHIENLEERLQNLENKNQNN